MNQKGMTSSSSLDSLIKQKRGRPYKEDNVVRGETIHATPKPYNLRKTKWRTEMSNREDGLEVGRGVTGFVETEFNSGFPFKAKVGDTQQTGVAFEHKFFNPDAPANENRPEIKNISRKDLAIPAIILKSHRYGSPNEVASHMRDTLRTVLVKEEPVSLDEFQPCIPRAVVSDKSASVKDERGKGREP